MFLWTCKSDQLTKYLTKYRATTIIITRIIHPTEMPTRVPVDKPPLAGLDVLVGSQFGLSACASAVRRKRSNKIMRSHFIGWLAH